MQRLLFVIALLLTLANVVSPALAASIAAGPTTVAFALADEDGCAVPMVDLHQKASFKPCSKTINGKSVLCHSPPIVVPVGPTPQFPDLRQTWTLRDRPLALAETFAGQFRPPRSAVA